MDMHNCELCPRQCGADRYSGTGFCGCGADVRAAKAYLHMWEEPCISGTRGSGTVFFSGCCLKCRFCQNYKISCEGFGKEISVTRLGEILLELQEKGAHNINLVSPTQFVSQIIEALDLCRGKLVIPVVYNTGGYERAETLKMLDGYVDIYLPDFKYFDNELAKKYSSAENYFETVTAALKEMHRQVGRYVLDSDGIMQKGLVIRHLTLPTHRHDSVKVLEWIAENLPKDEVLVSLMSQYTPFYRSLEFKELSRRISTFEYNFVLDKARELGLNGFMQEKSSAKEEYTPEFDLIGI
ncbi:MAG: radical SAM protein [Oscillospiraceae bacterium]|nr:radical SAM protein [Oscillospiraceae bacterium]